MKFIIAIYVVTVLCTLQTAGQSNFGGKTFINKKLDQIDFINDSILVATFRVSPAKYEFINDSIRLTLLRHYANMELQHSYKLIYISPDTLAFLYDGLSDTSLDTMSFINITKLVTKVQDFDSFRVDMYGFSGSKRLIIRKDKTVKLGTGGDVLPNQEFTEYTHFTLSDKKYKEFINMLSNCLVFMLPKQRGVGGYDQTFVDLTIRTNGQTIESKGVTLSRIHWQLFKYLFTDLWIK